MSVQADLMQRVNALDEAVKLLRAALHSGVWQRMTDYADGPATSRLDGMGGFGGASDPTARAALGRSVDMATNHRIAFNNALMGATTALALAVRLAGLYPARDVGELLTLTKGEPGCENCAQTTGPAGKARWEPIWGHLFGRTSVGGRLAKPRYLCRWCVDKVVLWDRLPTLDELELHHAGKRVPWPADVERPKEVVA